MEKKVQWGYEDTRTLPKWMRRMNRSFVNFDCCCNSESWSNNRDHTGAFLIDRSPVYFEPILNYLRHGKLILNDGVNPEGRVHS